MIKNYSKRDSPVLPGYLKASVKHKKISDNGSVALPSSTTTNKGESNWWGKFSSYQKELQIPHSACKTARDIGRPHYRDREDTYTNVYPKRCRDSWGRMLHWSCPHAVSIPCNSAYRCLWDILRFRQFVNMVWKVV